MMRTRTLFGLVWPLVVVALVPAQEVQRHGLVFESWERPTLFGTAYPGPIVSKPRGH